MKELLAMTSPLRWRLLAAAQLGALTEAAGLALMATATCLLVTAAGQPELHALTIAIVAVRALAISRGGLRYVERLAGHDAVLRMIAEVRARIFAALADRGQRDEQLGRGDVLSRMVSDVDAVQDLVIRVALPMVTAGLVGVGAVAATSLLDPQVALVLAAGLLLVAGPLPYLAARLAVRGGARLAPLRAGFAADTIDLVHGAADLAVFGARDRFEAAGTERARQLAAVERSLARRAFAVDAVAMLTTGLTAVAVLLSAHARGVPGVWVAVLTVATLATGELALSLLAAARKAAEIKGSLGRITELLRPPHIVEPRRHPLIDPPSGPVTLRLDRARVGFREGAPPALDSVDLLLPPGHRLAVVGPSGAGKSTLLGLLIGAVAPDSGSATANGIPIHSFDPPQWSRVVSGLTADAHLFHATVRDNLLLARPDAEDRELVEAATVAGLSDWIEEQRQRSPGETAGPAFLDVVVGEEGTQLSGGQRQRLALARAVLANPLVMLLDEPTEGLDPAHADRVLADLLTHLGGDRTVVLVTHRLSGLEAFDEVVVLDSGRILQRGRYEELVAAEGWMRAHIG